VGFDQLLHTKHRLDVFNSRREHRRKQDRLVVQRKWTLATSRERLRKTHNPHRQGRQLDPVRPTAPAASPAVRRGNATAKSARQPLRSLFLCPKYQGGWNNDSTLYYALQKRLPSELQKTIAAAGSCSWHGRRLRPGHKPDPGHPGVGLRCTAYVNTAGGLHASAAVGLGGRLVFDSSNRGLCLLEDTGLQQRTRRRRPVASCRPNASGGWQRCVGVAPAPPPMTPKRGAGPTTPHRPLSGR
jgi:hypothetical protein